MKGAGQELRAADATQVDRLLQVVHRAFADGRIGRNRIHRGADADDRGGLELERGQRFADSLKVGVVELEDRDFDAVVARLLQHLEDRVV